MNERIERMSMSELRREVQIAEDNLDSCISGQDYLRKQLDAALLQVEALQKQLRTAQEVINKHATDGIEGLHCVDCVAEDDEICDCPMLVPFWEAMKGFEEKK